jgi:hypothetical protein
MASGTSTRCQQSNCIIYERSVYIKYILFAKESFSKNKMFYLSLPPLWFSGQSVWLQMQRSGFDSQRYQIFWEVVGLERELLSLGSTIEELLGRKSSGSCLEYRDYGRRDPLRLRCDTLYPQKLTLIFPSVSGRSVGIVRSRTQADEFFYLQLLNVIYVSISAW